MSSYIFLAKVIHTDESRIHGMQRRPVHEENADSDQSKSPRIKPAVQLHPDRQTRVACLSPLPLLVKIIEWLSHKRTAPIGMQVSELNQ